MVASEFLQLLQLMAVLLGRLTALTARQTTEAEMLKKLVDRICQKTGPSIENYQTSVSETTDDPFYEYVQICYTVKRRKVDTSRTDEFVTSSVPTDVGNTTDNAEVDELAEDTVEDWARYDPHARNTSLWITLIIAAMSIAIVAVIILGPRYTKKCLQAIRRRRGDGRRDEGINRMATDDNMRYLYGEWDPATESEHTTPSGVAVNTVGLVMSTYVTGAAVGTTYDNNATCDGGYVYMNDADETNDVYLEVTAAAPECARTSSNKPEKMERRMTTAVTEMIMPEDDESSEFEQTEESEDCDESGSAEIGHGDHDRSKKKQRNSICDADEFPGAANDGFEDVNRSDDTRTGNDICAFSTSDDLETDWSCQAESSADGSVASTCEENIIPPWDAVS